MGKGTLVFALLIGTTISSSTSFAGTRDGGGGKGVLCGSTVRVLDLYEAETIYHLSISAKYSDIDSNLAVYGTDLATYGSFSFLDPKDPKLQQQELEFINTEIVPKFSDIPPGTTLPFTNDATLPSIPQGCAFVQIAIYSDDGHIYRDRELWDRLSVQDQAALVLHEGIYHARKLQGAKTSDNSRRIVGLVFAEQLPEPIFKPIWAAQRTVWCGPANATNYPTPELDFGFYAVEKAKDGQNRMDLYFDVLAGAVQMERISISIPGMTLWDFFRSGQPVYRSSTQGNLFNDPWTIEFQPEVKNVGASLKYGIQIRAFEPGDPVPSYSWIPCQINI